MSQYIYSIELEGGSRESRDLLYARIEGCTHFQKDSNRLREWGERWTDAGEELTSLSREFPDVLIQLNVWEESDSFEESQKDILFFGGKYYQLQENEGMQAVPGHVLGAARDTVPERFLVGGCITAATESGILFIRPSYVDGELALNISEDETDTQNTLRLPVADWLRPGLSLCFSDSASGEAVNPEAG